MSFFKNLSVGERARIEAQLREWEQCIVSRVARIKPGSWTINDDLTVSVDGHVWLSELDFEKLPVKFGKVTGTFSVWHCKNLITLEGCPEEVGFDFDCSECSKLMSLEGAPKKVVLDIWTYSCGRAFTETETKKHFKKKSRKPL